jgi:hypothetical protein
MRNTWDFWVCLDPKLSKGQLMRKKARRLNVVSDLKNPDWKHIWQYAKQSAFSPCSESVKHSDFAFWFLSDRLQEDVLLLSSVQKWQISSFPHCYMNCDRIDWYSCGCLCCIQTKFRDLSIVTDLIWDTIDTKFHFAPQKCQELRNGSHFVWWCWGPRIQLNRRELHKRPFWAEYGQEIQGETMTGAVNEAAQTKYQKKASNSH